MTIQVTRNPDNSYTITCGGERVTVGGDAPAPQEDPGETRPPQRGGKGPLLPTPTEGGATASIIESPEGRRVGLIYPWDIEPEQFALWLKIDHVLKHPVKPLRVDKPPIVVGWKGREKIDIGKLELQMGKLKLDAPLVIKGPPLSDFK